MIKFFIELIFVLVGKVLSNNGKSHPIFFHSLTRQTFYEIAIAYFVLMTKVFLTL